MKKEFTSQSLAEAFAEHRARLLSLVEKRLNPILLKRLSHEDVMQEVYLAAVKRLAYFAQNEDVPIYFKLRMILLQTLADIERKNLQAAGRDAYKEAEVGDDMTSEHAPGALNWGQFAADITGSCICSWGCISSCRFSRHGRRRRLNARCAAGCCFG